MNNREERCKNRGVKDKRFKERKGKNIKKNRDWRRGRKKNYVKNKGRYVWELWKWGK